MHTNRERPLPLTPLNLLDQYYLTTPSRLQKALIFQLQILMVQFQDTATWNFVYTAMMPLVYRGKRGSLWFGCRRPCQLLLPVSIYSKLRRCSAVPQCFHEIFKGGYQLPDRLAVRNVDLSPSRCWTSCFIHLAHKTQISKLEKQTTIYMCNVHIYMPSRLILLTL